MQVDGAEKPNTREIARRAPVEIVTPEVADSLLSTQQPSQLLGCRLCQLMPKQLGEKRELPEGSKEMMEKHLAEEHYGTPADKLEGALYSI
ncbi:hypothetical protein FS749_014722 [Ceratobasidium sp. UAMH 11750]|nr:hypothetical protein FS749_014722 [Ceratobasidium sp. UAMH 11750]